MFRRNNSNFYITLTRFSPDTFKQNYDYRIKNNIQGCIYGSPRQPTPSIPYDSTIFVFEMLNINDRKNDKYPGRIIGMSIIKNRPLPYHHHIYDDPNYNRFIYQSLFHIERINMSEHQENMMNRLDTLCFRGKCHMKRGQGFTLIPQKYLIINNDLAEICIELLREKFERSRDDVYN